MVVAVLVRVVVVSVVVIELVIDVVIDVVPEEVAVMVAVVDNVVVCVVVVVAQLRFPSVYASTTVFSSVSVPLQPMVPESAQVNSPMPGPNISSIAKCNPDTASLHESVLNTEPRMHPKPTLVLIFPQPVAISSNIEL